MRGGGSEAGALLSVHFEWVLDTVHGADYFRRWHRERANSGSLLIHKSSHHFDLVNWWLDDTPVRVYASAHRDVYGDGHAEDRGPRRAARRRARCDPRRR